MQCYYRVTEMRNRKILVIGSILLVALFIIAMIMNSVNDLKNLNSNTRNLQQSSQKANEPQFTKEGTLAFISSSNEDTLGVLDIEIADDEAQILQGLMYRSSMKENQGMLFIFNYSSPQSFWMKNTIISLDIIFVDDNFNIVTIHTNTRPYSEAPIPSFKDARYVVEVNAGYCSRHNIKEGDRIYSSAFETVKISV